MPDLHGWITQQITRVEETARAVEDRSAPWDGQWVADGRDSARTRNGHVLFYGHNYPLKAGLVAHVVEHDPATVLRRCTADRKILARHTLNPDVHYEPACKGCGTYGDMDLSETDNLNECPELLDLGYAHGLTPEILATLDQPETPARPERPDIPPPVHLNALVRLLSARPTSSVPPALRGPNWKAQP